ncbi:MAG TPA: hypothetical protein VFB62_17480 [Polyangiaceae bacterium]|nr:hypothetical protein [Polyangiaceae bacterium]
MARLLLVIVVLLLAAPVHAEGEERDPAAAQTLFEQALQLRDDGKLEEACVKFAESQRLDPQLGTLFNLADCYARTGKTASAWAAYVELEGQARPRNDPRADVAKKRAEELKPNLSAMRIEVPEPVEGLEVKRDDVVVGKAQWGEPVPVDPGAHHLRASAPGYKPWEQNVTLDPDGAELEVVVPTLDKAPDQSGGGGGGKGDDSDPDAARQGQLIAGIVFTGLGGAGLVVAGALQIVAKTRDDESLDHCGSAIDPNSTDENLCNDTGKALRDEARRLQLGAIVTVVAGGALAATGIILLLTMPEEEDDADAPALRVLPMVGPGYAGVGLTGHW